MKKGYIYIIITTLLFSSMEVALKFVAGDFNAVQMTFSRFFFGGLVLLPFAVREIKKRGEKISGRIVLSFAGLGLMGVFISMTAYQLAVMSINASAVGVLFSSNPIFVTLFAFLLLREHISKHQIAGLILDAVGILIIIKPWDLSMDPMGVAFILVATLMFSLYGVCGKRLCARFGGVVVTCMGFLLGAGEMMAAAGLTHIPGIASALKGAGLQSFANIPFLTGYSWANLPIVLYIFIGVTGVGYACYFLAMEKTSAQKTSLVFFFKPMLAPVLALIVLHEEIPLNMLIGIAVILAGSLVSILPGLRAEKAAPATALPQ